MSIVTFVLVPGAGGDPWYWHRVIPKLKAAGCEAVPVALPAASDSAGLHEYADAVLDAIGRRDGRRLILVAQSLGAFTAPLVCERTPVDRLVFVNAMIPKPGERPGEWFVNTGQHEAKQQQNVRDGRAAEVSWDPLVDFFHDVPQSITDEAWKRGEPKQSENIFSSPCTYATWPAIPIHALVATDDRFFPTAFQQRLARERLGLESEPLPGGHLVALSQPEALAARLLSYLDAS